MQTMLAASAISAVEPASESEQLSALDARSLRACTEESPQLRFANYLAAAATAGRAALQTIGWSKTEGAAITAARNAGRRARADGPTDDGVIAAAHAAALSRSTLTVTLKLAWRPHNTSFRSIILPLPATIDAAGWFHTKYFAHIRSASNPQTSIQLLCGALWRVGGCRMRVANGARKGTTVSPAQGASKPIRPPNSGALPVATT